MSINRSRRGILLGAGAALGLFAHGSARAALSPADPARRISLESLHTGERLSAVYWGPEGYRESALQDVARVLRDHRNNAVHRIEPALLDLLHRVRAELGTDHPFQVISGYRSPATNLMLASASSGVARESLHTRGMAIDIRMPGVPLARLRDVAKSLAAGGVGYYPTSDFVHLDVGRVRSW